jgi:hypothetical protein
VAIDKTSNKLSGKASLKKVKVGKQGAKSNPALAAITRKH